MPLSCARKGEVAIIQLLGAGGREGESQYNLGYLISISIYRGLIYGPILRRLSCQPPRFQIESSPPSVCTKRKQNLYYSCQHGRRCRCRCWCVGQGYNQERVELGRLGVGPPPAHGVACSSHPPSAVIEFRGVMAVRVRPRPAARAARAPRRSKKSLVKRKRKQKESRDSQPPRENTRH